jgi:deazaflavin-dependent oxidoreductase (nitroreductase family)
MAIKHAVADLGMKSMNLLHRSVMKLSGGRLLSNPLGMPTVELTTTGRRSGQPRTVLLTSPIHDGDRVVLVASKGGDDRHPDWYRNLTAHPEVTITIAGTTRTMTARTASAEEKADLWPQVTATYKGYASYQRRTSRDIPVVICEPVV